MTDSQLKRFRRAEARAFVAHHPSCRVDQVGDVTLVSIGAVAPPAMMEAIAASMDARAKALQNEEAIAA